MLLNPLLQEALANSQAQFPDEALGVIKAADEELHVRGVGRDALKAGDLFPDRLLQDQNGADVSLRRLNALGPMVVTFYRGGWCPYCNLELRAYQNALEEIVSLGGQLVAVTPEKPDNSLSTIEKNALAFPVLTDSENGLAKALGIAFELPTSLRQLFEGFGMNLPEFNADTGWALPVPATFVVNENGEIVLADVDPDYTRRLEPGDALAALRNCT
ncbi:MAG: peroxiredoxin-like family protein [Henriciella sp.]